MQNTMLPWLLLGFICSPIYAQEINGNEIIAKVNAIINQSTSYSRAQMTIVTTSGQRRTFVYDSWSKDFGEKNLVRYLEPRRTKGQATLMLNHADDIWMYFPRTQRVRKLASHAKKQKMEGSDFSYEDMGAGNSFIEDYDSELLNEEPHGNEHCYKVQLIKKSDADVSYSKMVIWVRTSDFTPIAIDYYAEKRPEKLEKQLIFSDIDMIQGIPTAKKMIMTNVADQSSTEMSLTEIQYNIPLSDDLFTQRGLKQ